MVVANFGLNSFQKSLYQTSGYVSNLCEPLLILFPPTSRFNLIHVWLIGLARGLYTFSSRHPLTLTAAVCFDQSVCLLTESCNSLASLRRLVG